MHSDLTRISRRPALLKGFFSFVTLGAAITAGALFMPARSSDAALVAGSGNPDVLFGRDDDNTSNPRIQPPGVAANQSMNNTDVLLGEPGNDILVGLQGSDTLVGGSGDDILIGGPEGFVAPNSDVLLGGDGNDINIWAPGDGSDAFVGGGGIDTMVFGVIDRDTAGRPTGAGPAPGFPVVPSANVTGQPGFCTVERTTDGSYEYLVRFFIRATGAQAVTVRLSGVERLICTSQAGGQITFADLTSANPQFIAVRRDEVLAADPVLGRIIR